jgi:hypothetical protein
MPLLWGQYGCNAVESLYVSTHWTRGAWIGEDRTIELLTRDDPPQTVRATAVHIQSGPLWTKPAHPRQNPRNVTGWNVVLTDPNNVILPDDQFSDGSKLRVRGLMWSPAGVSDKLGRPLHTPDDPERKFGVFVIEARDVQLVHEAPASTQPVMVYTTVPRTPPRGKVQLLATLVDGPGSITRNEHAKSRPTVRPTLATFAKTLPER